MSCLSVSLSRVGGIVADALRVGGGDALLERIGGSVTALERVGGATVGMSRIGGIVCRLSPVCASGVGSPYLEISPTLLWVYAEPVYNDVYSNTNWNVD